MADGVDGQPVQRATVVKGMMPADVVGELAQPGAAQVLGHAHVVVTGLGGGHAHLADQRHHFRHIAPVLAIGMARVRQELVVFLVPANDLGVEKSRQPVFYGFDFVGNVECDGAHTLFLKKVVPVPTFLSSKLLFRGP